MVHGPLWSLLWGLGEVSVELGGVCLRVRLGGGDKRGLLLLTSLLGSFCNRGVQDIKKLEGACRIHKEKYNDKVHSQTICTRDTRCNITAESSSRLKKPVDSCDRLHRSLLILQATHVISQILHLHPDFILTSLLTKHSHIYTTLTHVRWENKETEPVYWWNHASVIILYNQLIPWLFQLFANYWIRIFQKHSNSEWIA